MSLRQTTVTVRSLLDVSARRPPRWLAAVAGGALYLLALNLWRDQVPAGLNNDVAEEALRGVSLVEGASFEPFSLHGVTADNRTYGNSMETLFLYLLGAVAQVLGTTTWTIHATTWLFTLACIWLTCRLTRRIDPSIPAWIPFLVSTSSIWLFHYARSGLRANTAPVFLLAFTLLLERTERPGRRWEVPLACGMVLGLSLYGYTSCRLLPVAFVLHALVGLWRAGAERVRLLRSYAVVAAGALFVSLPNLLYLWRWPEEFLGRGAYVVKGGSSALALNVLRTLVLPLYDAPLEDVVGSTHYFDGVSVSLSAAGIRPLHPLVGALFLVGLAQAWSRRKETAVSFLLWTWLTGTVVLGLAGPSLTRLLLLLPVYLILASLGAGAAARLRRARPFVAAALLILMAVEARAYFVTFARNPASRRVFSAVAATPMGNRSRTLAEKGARIVCIVSSDSNVIQYLTHDVRHAVRVVEVLNRTLDVREIPLRQFQPHVILIDRTPEFEPLRQAFALMGTVEPRADFDEFTLELH